MKKIAFIIGCFTILYGLTGCSNGAKKTDETEVQTQSDEKIIVPEYTVLDNPQVELSQFETDNDGYIVLFNGKDFTGWRGYGKDNVPKRWTIEGGAIKFNGSGGGEAQKEDGGDIIFSHKFKNFELELEWKVSKGANSGIFYLAQEIMAKDPKTGEMRLQPIYISAPEAQILDNENHPDGKLGKNNNRQSMSLYDMIPAVPQNSKPFGEWNTAKIMVYRGTVVHGQNGENVVEYHLWTQQWTDLLQESKFSREKWPLAFELLNNCGGSNHEGYIGLQDHGDDVWFRNIRIKSMD